MAHAFNSSTLEAEAGGFQDSSLVCRVNSRRARTTQRKPVSKKQKIKNNKRAGGARKMDQRLRVLAGFPEVLSFLPSNHMVAHCSPNGYAIFCVQTFMETKHPHI